MTDRFTGTNPHPVSGGAILTIEFENPDLASQSVTVTISNGEGHSEDIDIDLDSSGSGSHQFTVPAGWDSVFLNEPSSTEHVVPVV